MIHHLDINSPSYLIVKDLNFCVVDLETTGGNHETDRIIEIGMVKVSHLEIKKELNIIVDPEVQIPDFIQKLTSIKQKDTKGKPKISEVIDDIVDFIGDDILVAHNTSFDVPFLNAVLKRLKRKELQNKVLCTNVMTKHLIPNITSSNLTYMSNLFNLNHNQAHRALDDAIASAELLIEYCKIFVKKGIKKVNQLYYPKNKFELDRIHFDSTTGRDLIKNTLKKIPTSFDITYKGKQGLILAIIPSENYFTDSELIDNFLESLDWNMITIKMSHPYLESLLYFSSHFKKFSEKIQKDLRNYLLRKFNHNEKKKVHFDSIDFIISNHLIREQVVVYSFLNLLTNSKNVFKVPAQQKKMYQYILSNSNRFESTQKGVKKTYIPSELRILIENYLEKENNNQYLFLSKKDIKNGRDHFLSQLEKYTLEVKNDSDFPNFHL